MESSGREDFKTVPGFAFIAKFEGDIDGFTLVKVLVATTVFLLDDDVKFQILYLPQNLVKEADKIKIQKSSFI